MPDEGIEPPTFGLQNRCSTAELIRHARDHPFSPSRGRASIRGGGAVACRRPFFATVAMVTVASSRCFPERDNSKGARDEAGQIWIARSVAPAARGVRVPRSRRRPRAARQQRSGVPGRSRSGSRCPAGRRPLSFRSGARAGSRLQPRSALRTGEPLPAVRALLRRHGRLDFSRVRCCMDAERPARPAGAATRERGRGL